MYFVASPAARLSEGDSIIISNAKLKPRLAASAYLNTAPLIWSFRHGSRKNEIELVEAVPSNCAELLAADHVDIALVPAIEYQRIPALEVVPQVCIASRVRVRSVILATKLDELDAIRKVALDESSRTSATLIKIIFREYLGFEPQWIATAPDIHQMLRDNDAALLIGDPAMIFSRQGLKIFDMASLWRRYTGLGFVFALWMISPRASVISRQIDLVAVRDEGLARMEEIVDYYQPLLGLTRKELQTYLDENISFSLDNELIAGLSLFYKLAHKHNLIPALKPLNL